MKRHNWLRKKNSVSIIAIAFIGCIVMAQSFSASARPIRELEQQQENLREEISSLNSQLVSLMSQIQSLEAEIAENEQLIADTEQDLADAQAAEQRQYQDMQLRIQQTYENGTTDLLTVLLESSDFSDFLNKMEYANAVYAYDRLQLDSLEATRIEIQSLKADLESQRTSLASQREQLASTQSSLNSLIESKRSEMANVDQELEAARAEAARLAAQRAAEREAARAAANAAAANAAVNAESGNSGGGDSGGGGGQPAGGNPAPTTGVGGGSVVSFANQFVGNPYVWGGNSLTNGCDCSGFVVQVYANFGINLSGSRNSAALRGVGQAVSYENMQPGDIVCYAGHVAIYNGNGTIVEAQNTRNGITNNRSVNYKQILAIRRVI